MALVITSHRTSHLNSLSLSFLIQKLVILPNSTGGVPGTWLVFNMIAVTFLKFLPTGTGSFNILGGALVCTATSFPTLVIFPRPARL